jgi:nickel-dependent lactate racemase
MSESTSAKSTNSSSVYCGVGSETTALSDTEIKTKLHSFLDSIGSRDDVLILPPDFTRFHSQAGKITKFICEYYNFIPSKDDNDEKKSSSSSSCPDIEILPALGTHVPMTPSQLNTMFGQELSSKEPNPFLVHDWRKDVVTIGHVPSQLVSNATNGRVDQPWPAQLNKIVWDKRKSVVAADAASNDKKRPLILSVGQVVPHEVMGMANFNKNLFVGVGGVEAINLSHFIGAVYGMENMMGRAINPLRQILNYASEHFLQKELDLWYILTVMGTNESTGDVEMKGFYIGNDIECYNLACELSLKVNFTMLERAPKKVVVHLDEDEFHSTWLGNKAIYRTRMAIADDGELIILAPGVKQFGEDEKIDELIRKYGYIGTPKILDAMDKNKELQENLSAVAHLIHGSSEDRFSVTYCPGHVAKEDVEGVGFQFGDLNQMMKLYDTSKLKDGWNNVTDPLTNVIEEIYFISNPALGLWAVSSRFENSNDTDISGNDDIKSNSVSVDVDQISTDNSGGVGGWKKSPIP